MAVEGGGYFLNNRMPYFSLEPGSVNVIVPGKRTRHTVNPALALKDGEPYLAWNTPGGDNQPQAMLQAFLNVVHFQMNVQQAVEAATVTSSAFAASMYPGRARGMLTMPQVLADEVSERLAALAKAVRPMMQARNGALLTLTYLGAVRAIPNYNVMGLAKASLEANVRYTARALGPDGIRVNAISAGPIRTLAAAGIGDFRRLMDYVAYHAPLGRGVTIEEVGNTAAFLCSDLASGITGEITYVDGGFSFCYGEAGD